MSGDKMTTGTCVEDLGDINVCVEHSFPVSAESRKTMVQVKHRLRKLTGARRRPQTTGKKISVISVEAVVIICVAC